MSFNEDMLMFIAQNFKFASDTDDEGDAVISKHIDVPQTEPASDYQTVAEFIPIAKGAPRFTAKASSSSGAWQWAVFDENDVKLFEGGAGSANATSYTTTISNEALALEPLHKYYLKYKCTSLSSNSAYPVGVGFEYRTPYFVLDPIRSVKTTVTQ